MARTKKAPAPFPPPQFDEAESALHAVEPTGEQAKPKEAKLRTLDLKTITIPIRGTADLIVNKFDEKTQKEIEDKGKEDVVRKKRGPRDSEDSWRRCFHMISGTPFEDDAVYGFPAMNFLKAMIEVAPDSDYPRTVVRRAVQVHGNLLPLKFDNIEKRTDYVRVGPQKVADIRYRPAFTNWSTELTLTFNAELLNINDILFLLNLAGFSNGVGEWRQQKGGQFGAFRVEGMAQVKESQEA